MAVLELALCINFIHLLVVTIVSDVKEGVIRNQTLVVAVCIALLLDVPYYALYCKDYLYTYLTNAFLVSAVSLVLYICHIWSAGDSKLLIVLSVCMPGRFLTFWELGVCPGFLVIVLAFLFASIYILGETIYLDVVKSKQSSWNLPRIDLASIAASYVFITGITALVGDAAITLLGSFALGNTSLFVAANFTLMIILIQARSRLKSIALIGFGALAWVAHAIIVTTAGQAPSIHVRLSSFIIVPIIVALSTFAGRYNYEEIPARTASAGQILSIATVLLFNTTNTQGRVLFSSEDMQSRMSENEAESIREWASELGENATITIVRKTPFAVFINLGAIVFLALEMGAKWL